jgi:hypothetical protein
MENTPQRTPASGEIVSEYSNAWIDMRHDKELQYPNGHWLAAKRFHSDVCDVTGYDAAEFFDELLLELDAHVGRAAERVGQLVQDGTDDRLPEASTTARSEK